MSEHEEAIEILRDEIGRIEERAATEQANADAYLKSASRLRDQADLLRRSLAVLERENNKPIFAVPDGA